MFPSCGYFKNVQCPLYQAGSCDRPNCHFKHEKRKPADNRNHSQLSSLSQQRYQQQPPRHTTTSSSATDHNSDSSKSSPATSKNGNYVHCTASIFRPHYEHTPFPTGPSTMVYKPTPISQLKKLRGASEKKDSTLQAVINAEFQVIGQQTSASAASAASGDSTTQHGQGDGAAAEPASEPLAMDEDGDDVSTVADCEEEPAADSSLTEDVTPTVSSPEPQDNKKPTSAPKPKRLLSKAEFDEYVSLFGEAASDDELESAESARCAVDDEVVEVAKPASAKPAETVIDLTGDTSGEESKSQTKRSHKHSKHKHKHKKSHKSESSKHKKSHSENHRTAHKTEHNGHSGTDMVSGQIFLSSAGDQEQCKELFDMFDSEAAHDVKSSADKSSVSKPEEPTPETSRKRTARLGDPTMSKNSAKKRISILSPQEMMRRRFDALKETAITKEKEKAQMATVSSTVRNGDNVSGNSEATSARTYKHTERRAHEPKSKKMKLALERPRISAGGSSKIPVSVRQMRLDKLIDECLKLYDESATADAYARAKEEEQAAASRASSKNIYLNIVANAVAKLRDKMGSNRADKVPSTVSHESVLAGKASGKFTVGLKRKSSISLTKEDMQGDLLFKKLRTYLLTESQLVEHGFPRPEPGKPGHAVIDWSQFSKIPQNKGLLRTCRRCGKNFSVTADGDYINKEECIYHWSKSYLSRMHGTLDKHFTCCQGKPGAEGCTICYGHVHETNKYEDLTGYMKTFAKTERDHCGVFALDCEMVYTTKGMEVARITVVDDNLKVMLDSLIKPETEIIDYNTRFSGLTAENFTNVDTTLKDVQAILLNIFQENTVLIGHSLNSDLVALKLIHDNVVDTSLVWPHKHGLPYKRALKNVTQEILNKLIQEAGSAGHDSSEDASACMELMKWKVYQDYMKDNR